MLCWCQIDKSSFLIIFFHEQEMSDLEKEFAAKKRMMVDDALNKLNEKYDKLRDDMMKRHDQELADLMVSLKFFP